MTQIWNGRRDKRSAYSVFDVVDKVLKVYKNDGAWNFLAIKFKVRSNTFQLVKCKVES